ncbi:MAG: sulfatase [Deltaproteobacteria bacterium]|nr:sulfatase [Deltaproteobacteria bacterium]
MRMHFLFTLLLALLLWSCKGASASSTISTQPAKPFATRSTLPSGQPSPLGVILITVDTMRADYLSSYGHTHVLTPNFDRLASGGVLFSQAFSQTTTTTPSHSSIMTSLYLQDHNVYSNFEALGTAPRTLAEILAGRGYATYAIVNMQHLNPEISGLDQGFATFVKSTSTRRAGETIDNFLSWLDTLGEKHFFAWLHLADVHTPYSPPAPYDNMYYDKDESDPTKHSLQRIWHLLPENMSDHPCFRAWLDGVTDLDWVLAQYQGAVTYVDDEIGRLIETLHERRLLEQTALVLTADHGESLGEHGMYFVHTGLYETTSHIPLIFYFPGSGRQGIAVNEVVESIDIYPTILEYLDLPIPRGIRGRSLWPLIRGEVPPPHIAMIEHAGRNLVALRSDRYKYIKHLRTLHIQPSYPFIQGKEELYDLKSDPQERFDIASQSPEILRVFRRDLASRRNKQLGLATGKAELTRETIEVLRSLGYVR